MGQRHDNERRPAPPDFPTERLDLDDDQLFDDDQWSLDRDIWSFEGEGRPGQRVSRRFFLGAAGIGGASLAAGAAPVAAAVRRNRSDRGRSTGRRRQSNTGRSDPRDGIERFGRIFEDLPCFAEPSDELTEALTALGSPGGLIDANDPLEVGPIRLITEPELSPGNRDNPTHTAGTTFVGQFIDHDITRDGGSTLGRSQNLNRSVNMRTPRVDLDSVYGGGPGESPELYLDDHVRFLVESGGLFEDLPRDSENRAIVAEPRNDENMMISGLQAAMLLFHNAVADRVEASGSSGVEAFVETQRMVRWHWQWTVVNEYLPQIVGSSMAADVLANGPRHYRPGRPMVPVEFQGAAYRFGHSMVRPSYRANLAGDQGEPFFAMVFDADNLTGPDPDTLLGGYRAPRRFIGWQTFFDFGDGEVKPNKRLDTSISSPLMRLPSFTIDSPRGADPGPTSLATRNLLRHLTWDLPSGQAVAERMGESPLSSADLSDLDAFGANLTTSTPLWFYILREADVVADGLHLGPIGGRIVGEVLLELIRRDPTSYLGARPSWRPTLPSASGRGEFRMADLLTLAGVDPTSRGQ